MLSDKRVPNSKIEPRGLRRADAAGYVAVSPTKFDEWVSRGVMPKPKRLDGIVVWDRKTLDAAFDALPDGNHSAEDDVWNKAAA